MQKKLIKHTKFILNIERGILFMFGKKEKNKNPKSEKMLENNTVPKTEEIKNKETEEIKETRKYDQTELLQQIVDHFSTVEKSLFSQMQRGIISKATFLDHVNAYMDTINVLREDRKTVLESFKKFIWGYHILEEVINDPSISDIKVMGVNNVRVKRYGKRENTDLKFNSEEDLKSFISYVAVKNQINMSDLNAIQTFTDKDSNKDYIMRFTVTTQFLTSHGLPYLHIRKVPKTKVTMDDLLKAKMFDKKTMDYLIDRAKNSGGILFTGKGASGKTTLMNALLDEIPFDKSGLVIQENEELFSNVHPEMMFEHIVTNRGEGKIEYTLKDLARTGLLTDLDYFVIGEIKGGEALYLLNASYTGHKCWASVHGRNSTEAMYKLADYVKYDSDYSKQDALQMLSGITTVVYMESYKVKEISEVVKFDNTIQDLVYNTVYRLEG